MKKVILYIFLFSVIFTKAQTVDSISAENYSAFFDSIFQSQLNAKLFNGASFVFVKDGKVIYENGYGFFDESKTQQVSTVNSVFYTASVSKIFPAIALTQLQQNEKCNFNDDITKYLKAIKLNNNFSTPVTIKNLVTHTAGLEDRFFSGMVKNSKDIIPLNKYFANNMPRVAMQPETQISYSNHGAALSGLIVQLISGIPFYQYAQQNIFSPLAMNHTSFNQPLPDSIQNLLSKKNFQQPFYNPYPAASCVTTADDMGKLISALLNDNNPILSKESLKQIFSQQWSANKDMPGIGVGFMQSWMNGQNGYFHTGDAGQHSIIFILPDKRIGFYAVYTNLNDNANNPRDELTKKILDKFFPAPKFELQKPSPDFLSRAKEYEGTFRINQYSRSTFEKIIALPQQGTCKANADGSLQMKLFGGGINVKIVEVSKDLFRGDDGAYYSFMRNKDNKIYGITISGNVSDPTGLEKINWYDNTILHLIIIALTVLITLITIILYSVRSAKKLFRKNKPATQETKTEKWIWRLPVIFCLTLLSVPIIGLVGIMSIEKPFTGIPAFLMIVINLFYFLALFGLSLLIFIPVIWKEQYWNKARRIYFTLFTSVMLLFVWFINYWNL